MTAMTDNNEPLFFWVAIKGPTVPHWPFPVSLSAMRKAKIRVGDTPDELTMWAFYRDERVPGGSNYDILIGYKTPEEQAAAVHTFLKAPLDVAQAEFLRAVRDEAVIWGQQ